MLLNRITDYCEKAQPTPKKISYRRVLNAAITLFIQQGYAGTSLRDISIASKLRKASLYHHFSTKEEMLLNAVQQQHLYCHQSLFVYIKRSDCSAEQRAQHFIIALDDYFMNKNGALLWVLNSSLVHRRASIQAAVIPYFKDWSKYLGQLFELFRPTKNNQSLVNDTMIYINGALRFYLLHKDRNYLTCICDYLQKLCTRN